MTLPKFLLAWSDFNWLWVYAKLRPAKDARWSFTRTVALTTLAGAAGALVGLLLGILFFHQPVGWLPWLLGLAGGCGGICWFGVTGLCWNQRAAQVRANPTLPTKLPKARYPFFRWCLGFVYIAILGALTPFALMVTVENIHGEITWKREHARLVAAGEKLTFPEILGPKIPDDQNAGAAAVFAPFFDYKLPGGNAGSGEYNGIIWYSSNALARIESAMKMPDEYLREPGDQGKPEPQTPRINLNEVSAAYRRMIAKPRAEDRPWAKELQLPEPGNAARDVLAGLAATQPFVTEVVAAAARPRSQFPVHYDDSFEAMLAHLSKMKVVQRALELHCAAQLALGNTEAAFGDTTNALNTAELLREEPLLISQLVRYGQVNIAVRTLWQGLAEHRWSDGQLGAFQKRLERVDYVPGLVLAFEGERSAGIGTLDQMIGSDRVRSALIGDDSPIDHSLKTIPRGMLRQNQAALAHCESLMLAGVRRGITNAETAGLTALVQAEDAKLENLIPTVLSPYSRVVGMVAPATGRALEKTARAQTLVKIAIVACALERYRIAHGEFPETLEQLSPQFVTAVPLDPMVNQPFRYQRTADGWFQLYSAGLNGKDDGGILKSGDKDDKEEKDWPWPVLTRPEKMRLF